MLATAAQQQADVQANGPFTLQFSGFSADEQKATQKALDVVIAGVKNATADLKSLYDSYNDPAGPNATLTRVNAYFGPKITRADVLLLYSNFQKLSQGLSKLRLTLVKTNNPDADGLAYAPSIKLNWERAISILRHFGHKRPRCFMS